MLINLVNIISSDIKSLRNEKQPNLISGSNIKTINGFSILGSGDLSNEIFETTSQYYEGGHASSTYSPSDNISGGPA